MKLRKMLRYIMANKIKNIYLKLSVALFHTVADIKEEESKLRIIF
jgi:hypothetical protein